MRSSVIKVPDRPTPAEQWTTIGRWSGPTRSRNARTKRASVCGGFGTPKSGHVVKWKWRMMRCWSPCEEETITGCTLKKPRKTHSAHHKFSYNPVLVVAVIQKSDLDISIIDWSGVVRPVVVALFAPFFKATRQHNNGTWIALPAHSPEVVSRGM